MKFSKNLIFCIALFSTFGFGQVEVLFSPKDHPTVKLVEIIDQAKYRIFAAIYILTDKNITEALIRAHNRKVEIKIILDKISVESPWSKVEPLIKAGIKLFFKKSSEPKRRAKSSFSSQPTPVVQDLTEKVELGSIKETCANKKAGFHFHPIMHNKYAIIDKTIWTGSFNWTISANNKNYENVLIISNEKEVLEHFLSNFQTLLDSLVPIGQETIKELKKSCPTFS